MFKIFCVTLVVSICIVYNCAAPTSEKNTDSIVRQKRVTCDLLSFEYNGISIGETACSVHCVIQGRNGGSCQDGVCVCKK
uniref:Defensin 2 n=1 Tax=Holotrichia oblita TaxID=644536 RepID=A0A8D4LKE9_HOLOL|nr:defensin 2 [Holotrichia oblita]